MEHDGKLYQFGYWDRACKSFIEVAEKTSTVLLNAIQSVGRVLGMGSKRLQGDRAGVHLSSWFLLSMGRVFLHVS